MRACFRSRLTCLTTMLERGKTKLHERQLYLFYYFSSVLLINRKLMSCPLWSINFGRRQLKTKNETKNILHKEKDFHFHIRLILLFFFGLFIYLFIFRCCFLCHLRTCFSIPVLTQYEFCPTGQFSNEQNLRHSW